MMISKAVQVVFLSMQEFDYLLDLLPFRLVSHEVKNIADRRICGLLLEPFQAAEWNDQMSVPGIGARCTQDDLARSEWVWHLAR
jgi:hypothetical protein